MARCCRALAAEAAQHNQGLSAAAQGTAQPPLADISNAAQPPKRSSHAPKAGRRAAAEEGAAQEAGSVLRSSTSGAGPAHSVGAHADLLAIAEEEACCIVRSAAADAPRRTTRASAARGKAAAAAVRSGSGAEQACDQDDGRAASSAVKASLRKAKPAKQESEVLTAALGAMSLGSSEAAVAAEACSAPEAAAPSPAAAKRRSGAKSGHSGPSMGEAVGAVPATPLQRTAHKGSRFAGMQTGCLAAPLTEAPNQAVRRRPPTGAQPRTALPPTRNRSAAAALHAEQGAGGRKEAAQRARTCGKGAAEAARTPFVLRRKAPDLDRASADVAHLGARMRGLALGSGSALAATTGSPEHSGGQPGRGPVLLVLDAAAQSLPWESLPRLQQQRQVPPCFRPPHRVALLYIEFRTAGRQEMAPGVTAVSTSQQ